MDHAAGLKLYIEALFDQAVGHLDLPKLMAEGAAGKLDAESGALRTILGLFILELVGNAHESLELEDDVAVSLVYNFYSDLFGLDGEAADALREHVKQLKEDVVERFEANPEKQDLAGWPDMAVLGTVMLTGLTIERLARGKRPGKWKGYAPTPDEVENFHNLCVAGTTAVAGDADQR